MKKALRILLGICLIIVGLGLAVLGIYSLLHIKEDVPKFLSVVTLGLGGIASVIAGIEVLQGGNIMDILHRLHLAS